MAMESRNPANGELLESFPTLTSEQLEERLARSAAAFESYRKTGFADRKRWLTAAAGILEDRSDQWGELMAKEMGKPVAAGRSEAEKCAWACRYYAEHGEPFLRSEDVQTDAERSYVRYAPLGPVLAVMPWNFPFWQVFRFAAPALMAGNVGLLKHASNVPQCALAIEQILREAGFPDDAFQTLLIDSEMVGAVLDDPRVRAATLTGSTGAGSAVAERAGKRIKKTVLELGGSDPFIVMPSADLDAAVETAVKARTINNGQSCIAAKRFIVHADVYDRFLDGLSSGMRSLTVGDPLDEATDIGPLATPSILDEVEEQTRATLAAGARLVTGGERIDGDGNYFQPTVLDRIPRGTPAWDDEIFGPVASVFRVGSAGEAIEVANSSVYGLGASAWTHDETEREQFIHELESGQVFINAMVASDPRLPFGGVKESGYGRELGIWGIREFVNVQTVYIQGGDRAATE